MKSSTHPLGTLIETDVLVIGSGASGCGAALGAREQGLDVVLLDKGKLESSGCIGGGNDHYMAVLNEKGAPFDTADDLVKFYSKPLTGYSPTMIVNGWYNHMYHMLKRLEDRGVEFSKNPDGTYKRTQGFGQPGTWWVHIANGMTIKRVMARIVRDSGVHVLDRIMAMKILTDGGKACGVLGWNVSTGEFVIIRAKTVVSAQGRSSTRGYNNSTHNPYNVWMYPYNTGAGVVLGYDAGAAVTELDTYQRATMEPKGYGCPGMNGINSSGAHEISAIGERFMFKYDPMGENGIRRNQMMGTNQEQVEGYGPPFYMDMRHLNEHDVHHLQYVLMPADKATYLDYCKARGIEFSKYPLEVEVGELSLSGMLLADDNLETPIRGLFAGCNFTSFSGAMCGGFVAGGHAAECAASLEMAGPSDEEILAERDRILAPLNNTSGTMTHRDFEDPIRQVMDYYAKFRRNMAGMAVALDRLNFINGYRDRVRADNLHDLMRIHEAFEILELCRIHLDACLQRKESGRGMYVLTDYPEKDPALAKGLVVTRGDDGPVYSWLEPAAR